MKARFLLAVVLFAPLATAAISHVAGGCSRSSNSFPAGNSFTFTCTANATNDAVVFGIGCLSSSAQTITAISLTATGWTTTQISGIIDPSHANHITMASFGAIAPNTSAATFTATFTGAVNCNSLGLSISDEFSGNDATGGTTTFDAHGEDTSNSVMAVGCGTTATVSPTSNNNAIWFACSDSVTGIGAPYTQGQNDGSGDRTAYNILTCGSGSSNTPTFTSIGGQPYTVVGVAIAPTSTLCPGGGAKGGKLRKLTDDF